MLMGIATFLVGLVPTYASIGIWGAVLLTLLRFIQGIGVGGEWGGSVLLSMEWARTSHHRGFVASWQFRKVQGYKLIPHLIRELESLTLNKTEVVKRRKASWGFGVTPEVAATFNGVPGVPRKRLGLH